MNIREIFRLYTSGSSKLSISTQLGISRNTVIKYIEAFVSSGLTYEELNQLNDHDLYELFEPRAEPPDRLKHLQGMFPKLDLELRKPGVDKRMLWRRYKAGDKLFVDFTGKKLHLVDKQTGEVSEAEVFVAVLGASQLTYVQAVASQSKEDFLSCVENTFHFMGGVPLAVVPDNLKAGVKKACNYEPILNESFACLLAHYGCAGIPTRSRKPRDKALVENAVRIVYRHVHANLHGQVFTSLEELNNAVWKELEVYNGEHFHNRPYGRRDLFEQIERKVLSPLPDERYDPVEYALATVAKNCHIHFRKDDHHYSVPYTYIREKVCIAYTTTKVDIYHGYKLIASHKRTRSPRNYTTEAEHLPSTHRYVSESNPAKFTDWAADIGEYTKLLVQHILKKRQHPEQAYKSCMGVLQLAKKFGRERLEKACGKALSFQAYNYAIVKRILVNGWDSQDEPEDKSLPSHGNIRGEGYYK